MLIKDLFLSEYERVILNDEEIPFKQTKNGVSLSADDFGYIIGCYINVYENPLIKEVGDSFFESATERQIQRALHN